MFARSKRLVLAGALAAVAAAAVPAVPAAAFDAGSVAVAPCRGDVAMRIEEWYQTVVLTGAHTAAGAIDVQLTCGVVRYGETVARVTENLSGPVAVVQGSVRVLGGPISICHELRVTYLDRVTYSDTCP